MVTHATRLWLHAKKRERRRLGASNRTKRTSAPLAYLSEVRLWHYSEVRHSASEVVGMEACATSHHWSRQLRALGHPVRLMPPAYVKPYVKREPSTASIADLCRGESQRNSPI
jgi:transposase